MTVFFLVAGGWVLLSLTFGAVMWAWTARNSRSREQHEDDSAFYISGVR